MPTKRLFHRRAGFKPSPDKEGTSLFYMHSTTSDALVVANDLTGDAYVMQHGDPLTRADIYNNLGITLQEQGQLTEAEEHFRQALEIKPEMAEIHNNLGITLQEQGRLAEAEACYRRALEIKPESPEIHNNLGITLQEQGRLAEAEERYRQALDIKPNYAEAHCNLGDTLRERGRMMEAEAYCRMALELKPNDTAIHHNLAKLLLTLGKAEAAMQVIFRSLQIEENPETQHLFIHTLARMSLQDADPALQPFILRALSDPWGRPELVARAATQFLKWEPSLAACLAQVMDGWSQRLSTPVRCHPTDLAALFSNPLLALLLVTVPICDREVERLLTILRHTLLETAQTTASDTWPEEMLHFYCALARGCFINEYVYTWGEDEAVQARLLREKLIQAIESDAEVPHQWLVAVAAYFPLHALPAPQRLLERAWPKPVQAILVQQIGEPMAEQCQTIPQLTPIEETISLLVQKQYEENPYPRWVRAAPPIGHPVTIERSLRHRFPHIPLQPLGKREPLHVLIAGCGTGQHAIETAQKLYGAEILAIDLSRASLCYAKRKTEALGITQITYAQADILKLGQMDRRFDLIESCGVLHHLSDPWAGWQILLSLLRPGGIMRLGFYSQRARRAVARPQATIMHYGHDTTNETIRHHRQRILDAEDPSIYESIIGSSDFYSTSACRDLLFHVQEHRMTLGEIQDFLVKHGLQFLGFDLEDASIHAYRLRFPDDRSTTNLAHWQTFEEENPDTFSAMYQFWVQKVDPLSS